MRNLAYVIALQSLLLSTAITAQANDTGLSSVFQSTEKLMDKDTSQGFALFNQIKLLNYMKKFNDKKGVARLADKLSSYSAKTKEIGTYILFESKIAQAEIFLGKNDNAKSRVQIALKRAPKMWLAHGNDRPFNSYIDLMGTYLEAGGNMTGLSQEKKFLDQVTKGYRSDGFRHQLYLSLGLMWGKAGYTNEARTNFQKAAKIALTFPSGKGRKNKRMNHLLSIASFQGQAGLYDDMANTILLIDTKDEEAIQAAWETIKATIDLRAKQTAQ